MAVKIQLRRDTKANWEESDFVLAPGEPGYEKDTGRFKIGNGEARWADLEYFEPGADNTELYEELKARVDNLVFNPPTPDDSGPSFVLIYQNAKV